MYMCMNGISHHVISHDAWGKIHPVITGRWHRLRWKLNKNNDKNKTHIPGKLTAGSPKNHLYNWKGKQSEPNLNFGVQNVTFPGWVSHLATRVSKRDKATLHVGSSRDHVHVWHAFYLAIKMRHMILLFMLVDTKVTFLVIFPLRTKWFGITTAVGNCT